VLGLSVLIGMAALAIDTGLMYAGRGQLQNSVDAAALAAAQSMFNAGALDRTGGEAAAVTVAGLHRAVDEPDINVVANGGGLGDVKFGDWNEESNTFTEILPGALNQGDVDAVSVAAFLDDINNNAVPATLSQVRGRTKFDIAASATAYIGYAGIPGPGDVDLPIVVDCCAINACPDSDPSTAYCSGGVPPVTNGCDLVRPQTGDPTGGSFSCLDFAPTGSQNACWTVFDNGASVNTAALRDIVNDVTPVDPPPVAGELYNLDNGSKAPVLRDIMRHFEGFPGWTNPDPLNDPSPDEPPVPAEGTDSYAPYDGMADQWYKFLPVFECQNGIDQCASGNNQELLGFVCVEIREIEAPDGHNPDPLNDGDKKLRLNFVCPTLPGGAPNPVMMTNCNLNGGGPVAGGGSDFGLKATIPVLVQ